MQENQVVDSRSARVEVEILEAIDALPWVDQLCPFMPHQYAVLRKSPERAWYALDAMIRHSPDSYRAYFRGYRTPNLYWDGPDGLRYWRTRFELNRCTPDSVEPPRRGDQGAQPILDWVGPPHGPSGSGLYTRASTGQWLPRFDGTDLQPCRGCQRTINAKPPIRGGKDRPMPHATSAPSHETCRSSGGW